MTNSELAKTRALRVMRTIVRIRLARELLIVLAFTSLTAIMTWPYVTRLRDAVVDPGDPYLISWILWWDYHATFTNPLHLFDANLFYPLRYTLAFSEHSYGISVLFFPLYALGLRPLTVHAIALLFGFALSGYGAFRLGRTLTGSTVVASVAGIVFAFVPYRFHIMSQVAYLFSPWIPLVFEALILFARERSKRRAVWLGCAFFMNGITALTWFNFCLIPLALYAAILLTRQRLWRDREFWWRGTTAIGIASVLLLPFMLPYVIVSRMYHLKRSVDEIKANSAWPIHWLSVESRNRLWHRMGDSIPEGWKFKLFPGLLPILFSLASLSSFGGRTSKVAPAEIEVNQQRLLLWLDALIVAAFAVSIVAIGFDRSEAFHGLFRYVTSERALASLTLAVIVRVCLAYPLFLQRANTNLIQTLRSERRSDAFWLGALLTAIGFFYSLGWNFFFFRICYDLLPIFRSIRVVSRGAMVAYLGLAILSGIGVKHLAETLHRRVPRLGAGMISAIACALLLIELNGAPLRFMRGEVSSDAVTRKLKQTTMRGGIVELPAGNDFNDRYLLRSADHEKPMIVGRSGFNSYFEDKIESMTTAGPIQSELMDLLETIPASYLVVCNQSITSQRAEDYQAFLVKSLKQGRLRFINRFDGRDDLYAVVKTEPGAQTEGPLPFKLALDDWAKKLDEDPLNLLALPEESQTMYRLELATSGIMPRYSDFMANMKVAADGVLAGSDLEHEQFQKNLRRFTEDWVRGKQFVDALDHLDDTQFVDRLLQNAGLTVNSAERAAMIAALDSHEEKRAAMLLDVVMNPRFVEKEVGRSITLLNYFAYLRRNPDDPPDHDLSGFNFWLNDFEHFHDGNRISIAFKRSIEYNARKKTNQ